MRKIQVSSKRRKTNEEVSINKINNIRKNSGIIEKKIEAASEQIKKLNNINIENPSTLIKFRQNITVPAMWVPQQGVRAANLGIIPPEKIFGLDTYIQANIGIIDGGDLDNPKK